MRRVTLSCMIGNAIEWYDFALYAYFVAIIGKLFFPAEDPTTVLLAGYGAFAAGFVMRPLGAVIFGYIGDKIGRKKSLTLSVYLMAIPTACIGLLPTYEQIGAWAAVLLTILRLLQGISMGGEFTGSFIFLVEHSPREKRGLMGSWAPCSLVIGLVIGSGVATVVSALLSTEALESWGWRIPFILSIVGGAVGSFMRKNLKETPEYEETKRSGTIHAISPLREIFRSHSIRAVMVLLIDSVIAVGFFMITSFISTYLNQIQGIDKSIALTINTLSMVLFAAVLPFAGWLGDKYTSRSVMKAGTIAFVFLAYPLFMLFETKHFGLMLFAQASLSLIMAFTFGPLPAILMDIFPPHIRYSGLSISHNISMAIFGGSAPLLSTFLITWLDNKAAPALYLMLASAFSFIGLVLFKKKNITPVNATSPYPSHMPKPN